MMDRWGEQVIVGWQPHEMTWIRAALTLRVRERMNAFADIASMTGRTFTNISDRAGFLRAQDRRLAADAAKTKRLIFPGPAKRERPKTMPTDLRQPSKSQLMGCR